MPPPSPQKNSTLRKIKKNAWENIGYSSYYQQKANKKIKSIKNGHKVWTGSTWKQKHIYEKRLQVIYKKHAN